MKKITIILVMVLLLATIALSAEGPVDKGNMIVGGEFSFTSNGGDYYENNDGDGLTIIGLSPFMSFFVAPSIAFGGEIQYEKSSRGDFSQSIFGVGPTVAYFFNYDPTRTEIKGVVYPYVQAYFAYAKVSEDYDGNDFEGTVTYFGGKGGIMYMLTKHWAVNTNLYYQSGNFKQTKPEVPDGFDDSKSGNTLGCNVGVTAFLF